MFKLIFDCRKGVSISGVAGNQQFAFTFVYQEAGWGNFKERNGKGHTKGKERNYSIKKVTGWKKKT